MKNLPQKLSSLGYSLPIILYFNIFRIGFDGKLTLEKRLKGIYITGQKIEETRKKLLDAGKAVPFKYVCFKFT